MERTRYVIPEIEIPKESSNAQITWFLGQDERSKIIANKLGYRPDTNLFDFIAKGCNRDPVVLKDLRYITGKSANFKLDKILTYFGTDYDNLQIGGFGNEPYSWTDVNIGSRIPGASIALPTTDNFAQSHPVIDCFDVIDSAGQQVEITDQFSFTGAYTREQALGKVAANLCVLETVTNQTKPTFIVPIPIAMGYYPKIINEKGQHAYFIAWLTPYEGKRTGVLDSFLGKIDASTYYQNMTDTSPNIACALRSFHDLTGLTHNQTHPGNYFVPPDGGIPLLTDFGTVYPISEKDMARARAKDLWRVIVSIGEGIRQKYPNMDIQKIINHLFNSVNLSYIGNEVSDIPTSKISLPDAMTFKISEAIRLGYISQETPAVDSLKRIEIFKKDISRLLAVD